MPFVPLDPLTAAQLNTMRAEQADTVNITITNPATSGTASIVFAPAFTASPLIFCQNRSGAGTAVKSTNLVTARTSAGFTVRVDLIAAPAVGTPLVMAVDWVAIKATTGPGW